MDDIANWILDKLGIGRDNAMDSAMQVLDHSRRANPFTEWWSTVIGNSLGLAIHISIVLMLIALFTTMVRRHGWRGLGTKIMDLAILFWVSEFFVFILSFLFQLSDGATKVAKFFGTLGGKGGDWKSGFLHLADVTDILGRISSHWVGMGIGWGLSIWATVISYGIYIAGALLILTYPTRHTGKWGPRFWRGSVAATVAIIFMKPMMMFFLAFGSSLIKLTPGMPGINHGLAISLICGFLAWLSPFAIFLATAMNYAKVEGKLRTWSEGGKLTTKSESNEKLVVASASRHTANMSTKALTGSPVHESRVGSARRVVSHEAKMAAARKAQRTGHPVVATGGMLAEQYLKRRNGKGRDSR